MKEANLKSYTLYNSNCVTFWERPICGDNKKISAARGGEEGGMNGQSTEDFLRTVKLFYMILQW